MKTKTLAFLTALLPIVLVGCNNAPPKENKTQLSSFSVSSQSTSELETPVENENREVETKPAIEQNSSKAENEEKAEERNTVNSEQPQTDSDTEQTVQQTELPNKADKTEKPVPKPETSNPEQTENKEPEPEPPKTEETPSEVKPDFNINDWILFAQEYAEDVGLELDSEAIYCWDAPLGAGAHSKYLERDITDCLNRYAKDEDITAVWIWVEEIGDNTFDLYIGYA